MLRARRPACQTKRRTLVQIYKATEPLIRTSTSIPQIFLARIARTPNHEAFRFPVKDTWQSLTWKQAGERILDLAGGLLAIGVHREDRIAIVSSTRAEWVFADTAILCAGGATTTIYPSSMADECAYIIHDSGSRFCFAEDHSQLDKLREQRGNMPQLERVFLIDGDVAPADADWVQSVAQLQKDGAAWRAANPDRIAAIAAETLGTHLATLIYTSGTTGRPKGVRLNHECWAYEADAIHTLQIIREDDVQYLWLPLAHSFGKVLTGAHLITGHCCAIDGRIPKLIDNLAVVRPTFMAAAPRIFEKVYNKVISGAKEGGAIKWKIFRWAIAAGKEGSALRQKGLVPSGLLAFKLRIADKLVFSKLKNRFGGKLRFFISGSAPLSREIAEFFHACDILILEGYGLTETSAAAFVNRPAAYKFGLVGTPLPGTEMRLAPEDNEILVRGPNVMSGYHNLPEQTREVLSDDGWLRTGDIGEVDADGFLHITDRKKDLIKTSGGKYIAPQNIEGKLKTISPYIGQVVVHGDKRNFCSALLTLDEEAIRKWATDNGIAATTYAEIVGSPQATALVQEAIDELNSGLAKYETIKKFAILPRDFTIEEGELTPSLKVKRKFGEKKYAAMLDKMYEGALADA
ncbi:MAG: long-chain fatty acid--CoA ligase [Myxococcales bacterium]|nr:long-chain fatty acid--CoA ligase [Myxococcales bacterium]